jgi:hypothetical protein
MFMATGMWFVLVRLCRIMSKGSSLLKKLGAWSNNALRDMLSQSVTFSAIADVVFHAINVQAGVIKRGLASLRLSPNPTRLVALHWKRQF